MRKLLILFMVSMGILNSCGNVIDSDKNIIKTPDENQLQMSTAFPNVIGNRWTYKVYDVNDELIDTLDVQIVATGSPTLIPNSVTWVYNYHNNPNKNFSRIISIKESSVFEHTDANDLKGYKIFSFPLAVGAAWYVGHSWDTTFNVDYADSARVVEITSQKFNNITYQVYKIERMYQINPGFYTTEKIEFIPKVGIFTDEKAEYYVLNEKLVLLSFSLK